VWQFFSPKFREQIGLNSGQLVYFVCLWDNREAQYEPM